jgi:hypothetical protein
LFGSKPGKNHEIKSAEGHPVRGDTLFRIVRKHRAEIAEIRDLIAALRRDVNRIERKQTPGRVAARSPHNGNGGGGVNDLLAMLNSREGY